MSRNIPFPTWRRIVPTLFGSMWFMSSLAQAFSPGKISLPRGQEAAAGEEDCWSCLGGNVRKNCRFQGGISSSSPLRTAARHPTKVPAKSWVPLTPVVLQGAFKFFDRLSFFIAQVLCGILLAFVVVVCFESPAVILLQTFTAQIAASGQAVCYRVNVGPSELEENANPANCIADWVMNLRNTDGVDQGG